MIILDTDHINELQNARGMPFQTLSAKMAASPDQNFLTTVITFEEQMRGWLPFRAPLPGVLKLLDPVRSGHQVQVEGSVFQLHEVFASFNLPRLVIGQGEPHPSE